MKSLKVKICGMKHRDNIQDVLNYPIDYMGFIFYKKSKRYVDNIDLDLFQHSAIKKVGVFVNSPNSEIIEMIQDFQLDVVQLHGQESPEQCVELKSKGISVWKAFGIGENFSFSLLNTYTAVVDCFLFDTKSEQHGGTGYVFDWSILANYTHQTPYFLSGGIGLENLSAALNIKDERLIGLDLNSKLEMEPGLKNSNLVNQALRIINHE